MKKLFLIITIIIFAGPTFANKCQVKTKSKKVIPNMSNEMRKFVSIFKSADPILGMIHLAPGGNIPRVEKALREITIMEENGVDAVIVENYHGDVHHVEEVLKALTKRKNKAVIGLNILPNEYEIAFPMARKYGVKFIQLDYVSGRYSEEWYGKEYISEIDADHYMSYRKEYSEVAVIGGVHPKYYSPVKGSVLENDINEALERVDAVVVTGSGTGMETPLDKIKTFRKILGPEKPLVIGAGVDLSNAEVQLKIGNGAIVGSYFKDGETSGKLISERVSAFMTVVDLIKKLKY